VPLDYVVENVRSIVGKKPVVGICLGHQLLCRAVGLETFKLPFGHRGANHPVKDLETGRIDITSQNHGFAVLGPGGDRTIEGDEPVRWQTDFGEAGALPPQPLRQGRWRASSSRMSPAAPFSTTRRPAPARTTPATSSTAFWNLPRRSDIQKILLIGSGPDRDRAGRPSSTTRASKPARSSSRRATRFVLVNSNPATIMTDPEFADRTYIEPLLPGPVAKVIEKERPDALLPTLGGQTALNLAKALHDDGTLERFGVELIGADYEAIHRAEDREVFRDTMKEAGLRVPFSMIVESIQEGEQALESGDLTLPIIVRPAFTLGGHGGGVANTDTEFAQVVSEGLAASPINQVLVEESVLGWGRVRARGDAGSQRQRRDHLLDRERRPDGRPYRRLRDDRAGPRPSPTRSTRSSATRRSA